MKLDQVWKTMSNRQRAVLTSGCIICGILLSILTSSMAGNVAGRALQTTGLRQNVHAIVEDHLDWANDKSLELVDHKLSSVGTFFDDSRTRTRKFAEEALSLQSKWLLVKDYLTQSGDHPRLLREKFESVVFSQEQIDDQIESAVSGFLRDIQNVESEMLVRMKKDLANLPDGTLSGSSDSQRLADKIDAAVHDAVAATQAELRASIGVEIASYIAGEIITHASIQLATSTGILGTGALSGPATFGISTVVGLIVDQLVSEIYNQAFDPAGELSGKLNEHLLDMESLVFLGTPQSPGLIGRLMDIASQRLDARDKAVYSALQSFGSR